MKKKQIDNEYKWICKIVLTVITLGLQWDSFTNAASYKFLKMT